MIDIFIKLSCKIPTNFKEFLYNKHEMLYQDPLLCLYDLNQHELI